jgi:hypothetical protein
LKLWRKFLRWVYYLIPDDYAADLFEKYKPDLLFAVNMFSAEDFRLLRYAKKHGVKTITTAKSWDVLNTKAFTRVIADRICVFNEFNRNEAIKFGDYPPEKVTVVGFPQFDVYRKKEIFISREEFFNRIGADLKKTLILFAVPGDWKNPYTHEVMIGLDNAIEEGKITQPVQILARFHPKYPSTGESLKGLKNFIMDRPGTYFSREKEKSLDTSVSAVFAWTFTDNDIVHLANSIYHSAIIINTESTMALDAAAMDKPVILIGYDGFQKLDYWHSILRNYDKDHFRHVMETNGCRLAKSLGELVKFINMYLDNPKLDAEQREDLRKKLLYKVDGQSSKRLADAVLEML